MANRIAGWLSLWEVMSIQNLLLGLRNGKMQKRSHRKYIHSVFPAHCLRRTSAMPRSDALPQHFRPRNWQSTLNKPASGCLPIFQLKTGIRSTNSSYNPFFIQGWFQVSDELARLGYLGVIWGLGGGNAIGLPPILNYGSDTLKEQIIPGVINGTLRLCLGITEPQAGSDVAGIGTTAEKTPDGKYYIVNGQKKWYTGLSKLPADWRITNGLWADYMTAAVRTGNSGTGALGISVLVIPLTQDGVTRRKLQNSGVAASGSTFVEFDNVRVPVTNLLGRENQGFQIIMSSIALLYSEMLIEISMPKDLDWRLKV